MDYLLLHGNIPVIEFSIDKETRFIDNVNILNEIFSPIRLKSKDSTRNSMFNYWISNRCIPNSRDGINRIKYFYNINDLKEIMLLNHGLSLSDTYWIDKKPFNNKWENINLYENKYNEIIGKILFDDKLKIVNNSDKIDFSPEACTGGKIKKKWINENGVNYLIKSGSGIYKQEPFNEYYASLLLNELNFNHVKYELSIDSGEYVSKCICISDLNKEMVTADDLRLKYGLDKSYESIRLLGKKKGNIDFVKSLDRMIITDYLIDNTDRHWQNFGVIRDTNTGSWIEAIPLFDHGYSLWNNDFVDISKPSESQSFKDYNIDNMKFVKITDYIKNIPDFNILFDKAFENFKNIDRKRDLKYGINAKFIEIKEYFDKEANSINSSIINVNKDKR